MGHAEIRAIRAPGDRPPRAGRRNSWRGQRLQVRPVAAVHTQKWRARVCHGQIATVTAPRGRLPSPWRKHRRRGQLRKRITPRELHPHQRTGIRESRVSRRPGQHDKAPPGQLAPRRRRQGREAVSCHPSGRRIGDRWWLYARHHHVIGPLAHAVLRRHQNLNGVRPQVRQAQERTRGSARHRRVRLAVDPDFHRRPRLRDRWGHGHTGGGRAHHQAVGRRPAREGRRERPRADRQCRQRRDRADCRERRYRRICGAHAGRGIGSEAVGGALRQARDRLREGAKPGGIRRHRHHAGVTEKRQRICRRGTVHDTAGCHGRPAVRRHRAAQGGRRRRDARHRRRRDRCQIRLPEWEYPFHEQHVVRAHPGQRRRRDIAP